MKDTSKPWLEKVTGITLVLAPLAYAVVYAVLFTDGYSEQLRTVVVTAILAKLLPDISSYWFDSSANQAKKDAPPDPPAIVTTTTTTGIPEPTPAEQTKAKIAAMKGKQ